MAQGLHFPALYEGKIPASHAINPQKEKEE